MCATTAPAFPLTSGTSCSSRSSPPSRPEKAPDSVCRSPTISSPRRTAARSRWTARSVNSPSSWSHCRARCSRAKEAGHDLPPCHAHVPATPAVGPLRVEGGGSRRRRYHGLYPSDVDLLRNCQRIVDLDPEIADRAFQLGMPEQKLDRAKISGASIDQGDLRPAERVRAIHRGIQSDRPGPLVHETRVVPGGKRFVLSDPTWKQILARSSIALPDPLQDCFARLFGYLELDGTTGLLLHDHGPLPDASAQQHGVDPQPDQLPTP